MTTTLLPLCLILLAAGAAGARGLRGALAARADWVGAGALGLTLALWLPARGLLPLPGADTSGQPAWAWRVDEAAWQVSLWLLLLALATAIAAAARGRQRAAALAPALAAAALPALWAQTVFAWLVGLTALLALWSVATRRESAGGLSWVPPAALGLGLPLMAQGAALQAGGQAGLVLADLSATLWPALAAVALLGAFPLHFSRLGTDDAGPLAPLLGGAPALVGAALLGRLTAAGMPGPATLFWLTLLGLLSLLAGLVLAWRRLDDLAAALPRLGIAVAGLVLLGAAWVGPAAALAEARVLALAFGALLLVDVPLPAWPRRIVVVVAAAALAGLPLTAGFAGRAGLFDLWWADRRWVLLAITALLQAPLAAGALCAAGIWEPTADVRPAPAPLAAAALPALALVGAGGLVGASVGSWGLVLLPAALAVILSRGAGPATELAPVVRQALATASPISLPWSRLAGWWRGLLTALREAATILESEGGMLWLLLFLVLFWLARQ